MSALYARISLSTARSPAARKSRSIACRATARSANGSFSNACRTNSPGVLDVFTHPPQYPVSDGVFFAHRT
jgi:hypothetical protein